MPRGGQKSKLRAREKHQQARGQTRSLQGAQVIAAQEGESPSCPCPVSGDAAGPPQKSPGVPPTSAAAAPAVSSRRLGKGAKSRRPEGATSSKVPRSTESSQKELVVRKAEVLMQYLMYKYKTKDPILKREMLKTVHKRFREHFPEILKIASRHMELVFGLELKELKPGGSSYTLASLLDLTYDKSPSGDFPKTGLLLALLGLILHGYCATEDDVWEFLSTLGVTDRSMHFAFGDVKKLLTEDLVQEKYLEYHQVPGTDPPRYQFLWGSGAQIETGKIKVLEFLAKVTCSDVSDFALYYEEALRDEKEKTQAKVAAGSGATA
ncbi:Melanoma-associated antigen B4 [Heterocephalus glaber]|uniref:Melanoma-associated antigen B4 n=1 Tax=Heterocephalus glaber TaxID=10181 RepID=G5C620_HETGA|nr:melanoma-associated antigen B4 [Heterocephalus glaber]EHB16981.1 Melanoma-associated antigen B4 [Heterocephalus glaber]